MVKFRIKVFFAFFLSALYVYPAVPTGYYNTADGLKAAALKTQLCSIIKNHTALSYADLWTAFYKTDARADGKVWDIYSNATNYAFGTNQCGNYSGEGSCYNREHSFPKSWFGGEVSPMYTDLFHLYPSDGYVNNQRSNYPFGNVANVTYSSKNSYCLLGTSAEVSGLTVFEPADELKGDMARTYFYMVTCYEDKVAGWKSNDNTEMLSGDTYPALSSWAKQVLLEWSRLDPVSDKERKRNDVIYTTYQHNRNPYIDYPNLAEYVWGDSTAYAFQLSRYVTSVDNPAFADPLRVWSEGGKLRVRVQEGMKVTITDLSGRLVLSYVQDAPEVALDLRKGSFYIVRAQNQICKIIL